MLKEAGIFINKNREIDTSALRNPEVEKSIKANPLVKLVLETNGEIRTTSEKEYIERTPIQYSKPYEGNGKLITWDVADPYKRYYEDLKDNQIETVELRHQRLEEAWQTRKPTDEEQLALQNEAVDKLQEVRRKIDHILARNGQEPIYTSQSKEDLMLDSKFNLRKMAEYVNYIEEEGTVLTPEEELDLEVIDFFHDTTGLFEKTVNPFYGSNFSYSHQAQPEIDYSEDGRSDDEEEGEDSGMEERVFASDSAEIDKEEEEERIAIEKEKERQLEIQASENRGKKKGPEKKKSRLENAFKKLTAKEK
mmetsp:Transcript_9884/g.19602  ORF Transcript_9884/g.19602 Transcript_9884/m.19602 type:complete len:307 (+) Transcript_9884:2648-3568(+)